MTIEVETAYADLNGTRLYYELAGAGDALVLVHGFGLDRRMWDSQFTAFAEQWRVVRYDLRGFGRSAPLVAGRAYRHIDDLVALAVLGKEDVVSIGQLGDEIVESHGANLLSRSIVTRTRA